MDSKHQTVKIPMESRSGGAATAEQEMESFYLPLGLFWYMSQAYKEEIKGIEGDNGVQIKAEVKVSFEVGQNAGVPNLTKAKGEFKDLVQSCLRVYDSRTSSLKDVDPGDCMATLKTLQREEAKVVLTASSEECTVWGPRESLAALPKSLTRPKYLTKPKDTPGKANISPSASVFSQKIGLKVQDNLVSHGIIVDEILWQDDPEMLTPSAPPLPTSHATYYKERGLKNDWEAPLQSLKEPSKKSLSSPAPFDEESPDAGQGRTPAEGTEGVVQAMVDCQWKDGKSEPKQLLQNALQRWLNNNTNNDFKDTYCDVKSCSEDGRALIHIKPASVIEALLQLGGTEVTTKDGQKATIWFLCTPVPVGTPTPDSNLMDVPALPPATQDVKIPIESRSGGAATAGQDTKNYPVPLGLFWYMKQAYKEKIKHIERDNGVQIKAEVKVSIEVDQRARTNLSKACGEFTDLVLSCLSVSDSRTFPLRNADPANWTATLKTLQRQEAKVVLTASSEECTVWGPRESLAALPKSLTEPKDTPGKANISPCASAWGSPDTSQKNLGPAVNELEKDQQRIGYSRYNMPSAGAAEKIVGSVFKQEDKQRIGYSGYKKSSAGAASIGGGATAGGATEGNSDEKCPMCLDTFIDKQKLKCGDEFCKECLKRSLASMGATCPVCKDVFGKMEGDQPQGRMSCKIVPYINLPGFDMCGAIAITYDIPTGTQTEKHPNPGKTYYGIQRVAYLPDNEEGREVLQLLRRAFVQKLIFTIGTSRTTGAEDVVTWNDIHHKTNTHGGPISFGYPDPNYLSRVKDQLKAKGIE